MSAAIAADIFVRLLALVLLGRRCCQPNAPKLRVMSTLFLLIGQLLEILLGRKR